MSKPQGPSRLILPLHLQYDLKIEVMFDTKKGNTEIRLYNLDKTILKRDISLLQVAGVLSEHTSALLRQVVSGNPVQVTDVVAEEGGSNGQSTEKKNDN